MVAGMLLMAVAGTMVVMSSPPLVEELAKEGERRLGGSSREAMMTKSLEKQARVGFGSMCFQMCIGVLFAFLYNKQAVEKIIKKTGVLDEDKVENPHSDDFETGICGCFDDKWVCIHGLCCPLVRMAHTNAVAGIMDFWTSIFVYFCCAIFTGGIGPCCLMVHWRGQLKHIMRIEDHCFNDVVVTLCLPSLSICQQGTAVDRYMGYEVTGCCDVEYND